MTNLFKDKLFIFEIARIPANRDKIVYKNLTKKKFDDIVQKSLLCLKPDYRVIIENTYLKNNPIWWCSIYGKSSYYKRRKFALTSFFNAFEILECLTK